MDYKKVANDVIDYAGGADNIKEAVNCMTRLRMEVVDFNKVDIDKLKGIEGIVTAQVKGSQIQVIIGPHVPKVIAEFPETIATSVEGEEFLTEFEDTAEVAGKEVKKEGRGVKDVIDSAILTFSGFFFPTVLALGGAGMIKGVLAILTTANAITDADSAYKVINMLADGIFYFLPFFLAVSVAEKMKTNKFLALVLAATLMYPTMVDGAAAISEGGDSALSLFGLPIPLVNYSGSVVPIILSVILLKYVYNFLDKYIPKALEYVVTSSLALLITGTVMLSALAPFGNYLGGALIGFFVWLFAVAGPIAPMLLAAVFPLLVIGGMNMAVVPVFVTNIATLGYDTFILPYMVICNINMGIAALVIALKTRQAKMRTLGISTGITALLGITEPAMYGVVLRYRRPFAAVMIANAISGLAVGILQVKTYAIAGWALTAIPGYLAPEGMQNFYFGIACMVLGSVSAFILTWILTPKSLLEEV
ncbi:MAG: PTS transporter subunit EIIC [Bifidobacteriaceae bacterium]|jgi:PTS system beta-glucosides-specific IIC component|nr:PTS transporter subunit EIIC [Bifidobacteriaceae bacterium]